MIIPDICRDGKWLRTLGTGKDRRVTRAGAYYAEMKRRCNSSLQIGKYKSYAGCTCDFKDFQDFAEWAIIQIGYGGQLDKDIIRKGNKIYSKDFCSFVPLELNNILTKCESSRGKQLIGISLDLLRGYKVTLNHGDKKKHLGYFTNELDAFYCYKRNKEVFIKKQAHKWKDSLAPRTYEALVNYQVEITD